jgi:FkbM family methyltransferase
VEISDPNQSAQFNHYSRKHRLIAWISVNLFDGVTYTVRHGLLKGMRRKGGLGWLPRMFDSTIVTAEHKFWSEINLNGMTVYDVGAFQGMLALFFAARAGKVVCFEPNSRNYARLMENLTLNGINNVEVCKAGVGAAGETRTMVGNPLMPGGSSVEGKAVEVMLQSGDSTVVEEIRMIALDDEIPKSGLPGPNFIKIDIEGWELAALQGARETLSLYQPALFLEMHGSTMLEKTRKVQEIVAFLWENNYRNIFHVETGTSITPENASLASRGHLYCQPCSQ